jgi:hypothetical protein
MRNHAGLARASAGKDEERAVRVKDGRLLLGVERGEKIH